VTASQDLYKAVNRAANSKHKANASGSFTKTTNLETQIISFSGSFQVATTKSLDGKSTNITPVSLFDTVGTENQDLFNTVFDNLTNPPNPAEKDFQLSGNLASDGKGHLIFSYSGQLPFTEVDGSDGTTATRTIPPYFLADVPAGSTPVTPTSGK
jgi:hypothetical protein